MSYDTPITHVVRFVDRVRRVEVDRVGSRLTIAGCKSLVNLLGSELRLGAEGLASREGLRADGGHGHGSGHL